MIKDIVRWFASHLRISYKWAMTLVVFLAILLSPILIPLLILGFLLLILIALPDKKKEQRDMEQQLSARETYYAQIAMMNVKRRKEGRDQIFPH